MESLTSICGIKDMYSSDIQGIVRYNHNFKRDKCFGCGGDCAILNGWGICVIKGKNDPGMMGNINGVCMDWVILTNNLNRIYCLIIRVIWLCAA